MTRNPSTHALLVAAIAAAGTAYAQDYPARPVRIITAPAGGGNDFSARLVARGITGALGQQVIVDNRPTLLGPELAAKADPDGYTVFLTGSAHWIGPLVSKVSYDPIRDFASISLVDRTPVILLVHPSLPVKSVAQLIALAKARPGELNFSTGGAGSSNYVGGMLFKHLAKIDIVRIPYKGSGPAMTGLMSGEAQLMFGSPGGSMSHVKANRLRALGVGSARRSSLVPELPTLEESGVRGFVAEALHVMLAPAATSPAIVSRLHKEIGRYVQSPEGKNQFLKSGVEPATSTPEGLTRLIRSEMATIGRVLRVAGVNPQ